MADLFTNQLSAYLDGELDPPARARFEAHLAGCPECSAALADLRAIVTAAPFHPGREPARDLWPELRAGLTAEVVPIGSARTVVAVSTGRRFGWRELIAASLLMAGAGAGAAYLALARRPLAPTPMAVQPAPAAPAAITPAKSVGYAEGRYDAAVQELQQLLEAGRSRLDSTTVRSVEENLAKIDAAISEARAAVQRDPSNTYLNRQIAANMRRKLNLLRTATNAIAART